MGSKSIQKKIEEKSSDFTSKASASYGGVCPVCKIKNGTVSFNCGCPVLLCTKCFNDNVYVFKFNRCPGCNKPYDSKG